MMDGRLPTLDPAPPTIPPTPVVAESAPVVRGAFGIFSAFPVLLPLGLITLFAQITYSGVNNVTLLEYVTRLGATRANDGIIVGWLCATFLLAETFLRVPFGWLSDRFGRARLIIGALLLSAPSFLLGSTAVSYGWLFPLRWWDGMMAAALWPSLFALVGDTVPQRFRANAMGAINMMYMLALIAGSTLAVVLLEVTRTPRAFFLLGAAAMTVGGVLALLVFRARPQLHEPHPEVQLEDEEKAVRSTLHHVPLLVITFMQNFAITILAPFMVGYVKTDLGFSLQQLGILVGVPLVGIGLLALPLSRVGDVVGKITVVRIAFTVIAVALWAFAANHSLVGLALIVLVIGVAFAMGIPAWLAIITSLSTRSTRGVTMAAYGTVQGLAAVLGPLAGGYIWNTLGHAHIFMGSAAAVTLAAILTWVTLPEHHRHSPRGASTV